MELEQVSEQLQALVNRTVQREKSIFNMVLGVASPTADFQWSGAAGVADVATGRAMEPDTPFLIASITKMYTAAAVMILQERGRLNLDDLITRYLPEELTRGLLHYQGADYTDRLTVRHLLAQTSGLPDYFLERPKKGKNVLERILAEGDRAWKLDEVVAYTRNELPARFVPAAYVNGKPGRGTKAHYSDTNYKLLGAILEFVTGNPLHRLFEELFFEPLELTSTYMFGQPRAAGPTAPAQVFYKERPLVADRLMASHGPEGGIVSTVADTLRFGRAFMTGELFDSRATLDTMRQWNRIFFPLQYGYGLMRFKLPWILAPVGYSPELIGHSGSSGSFLYYDRKLDLYLTGTINQLALERAPFAIMMQAASLFRKASRTAGNKGTEGTSTATAGS